MKQNQISNTPYIYIYTLEPVYNGKQLHKEEVHGPSKTEIYLIGNIYSVFCDSVLDGCTTHTCTHI